MAFGKGILIGHSLGIGYRSPNQPQSLGALTMVGTVISVAVRAAAAYAVTYMAFSLVCKITKHDNLIMLHMYSSPVVFSFLASAVFLLTRRS